MKYLCLVYFDEKTIDALPTEEVEALWREARIHGALRGKTGYLAAALQPSRAAITVRRRGGEMSTTDGPFAETTEQLGGFLLIDAADLDAALDVASKLPAARFGSVEVRPVRDLEHPARPAAAGRAGDPPDTRAQRDPSSRG